MDMTTPVDAAFQDNIYSLDKNGEPSGWGRRPEDLEAVFRLRRFHKTTFREYTNGDYPSPLAAAIRLPALRGSGMAWGDEYLVHDPAITSSLSGRDAPSLVLARVAEREAAASARAVKVERPIQVKFELLGDVVPMPPEQPIRDTVSRRVPAAAQPVRFGSSPFSLPNAGRR